LVYLLLFFQAYDMIINGVCYSDIQGAAPLLCAGITTWSPLRHWQVGKGSNVAVIGLGHMALKLAKGLGVNVTLFTCSPGKKQDARRLGADNRVLSTDEGQMAAVNGQFDLIIWHSGFGVDGRQALNRGD
jgi:alcohol dehydrogenase (NADP+)